MTRQRAQSLAGALPFWNVLRVPDAWLGDAIAHTSEQGLACLLLKDGTVAVGIRLAPFDAYGANDDGLDLHAHTLRQALANLPDGAFWQTIFAAGFPIDETLEAFANAGHDGSQNILVQGRRQRRDALAHNPSIGRVKITHWFGQRRLLKQMSGRGRAADIERNTAIGVRHCKQFLQALAPVLTTLKQAGLRPVALSERDIVRACSTGVYGPTAPPINAPRHLLSPADIEAEDGGAPALLGRANLDAQLAQGSLAAAEDHLQWQVPWAAAPRLLQVSAVSQLGERTHAKLLHDLLYERAPKGPWLLSVCHEKSDQVLERERLQQRRKWLFAMIGSHFLNHEAERAYQQTEQILADIAADGARIFRTNITCVTSADGLDTLSAHTRDAQEALRGQEAQLDVQAQQQMPAWLSSLPGYGYSAPTGLALLDSNCAHLVPSWEPPPGDSPPDIVLGNRQRGVFGLSVRVGPRHDASAIVVGKTGSGKTFLFSFLAKYGCLNLGGHLVLADNKGPKNSSYKPLCDLLGGTYVHLEADESVSFNPFPARDVVMHAGEVLPGRVFVLEQILAMMVRDPVAREHDDYLRSVVSDVVRRVYRDNAHHRRPLVLDDALAALKTYSGRNDTLAAVAQRAYERLEFWCEDPVRRRLFNSPHVIDTSNRFCVFDFFGMDRDPALSGVLIAAFAGRIEDKMRDLPVSVPKMFAFDEAWSMFDHSPEATQLLNRLYRTARSYGACCYVLTQSYRDIQQSKAASGILSNLALVFLMRHQDGHDEVARMFHMTPRQAELFTSLRMEPGAFAETMMLDGNRAEAHILRYAPLAFDLWCDTSRAHDVEFRRRAQRETGASLEDITIALAALAPRGAPAAPAEQDRIIAQLRRNGATPRSTEKAS